MSFLTIPLFIFYNFTERISYTFGFLNRLSKSCFRFLRSFGQNDSWEWKARRIFKVTGWSKSFPCSNLTISWLIQIKFITSSIPKKINKSTIVRHVVQYKFQRWNFFFKFKLRFLKNADGGSFVLDYFWFRKFLEKER